MKRALVLFAAVANLAFVDELVKEAAVVKLKGSAAVSVIPGLFNLAYVENRGCAWGLLQGHVWPLAAFGILALAVLLWQHRAIFGNGRLGAFAEPLLYAGIVGNLVDRIFRGYVVDLFDFHWGASHFPCFNLADAYICVAAGLLILSSLVDAKSVRVPQGKPNSTTVDLNLQPRPPSPVDAKSVRVKENKSSSTQPQ